VLGSLCGVSVDEVIYCWFVLCCCVLYMLCFAWAWQCRGRLQQQQLLSCSTQVQQDRHTYNNTFSACYIVSSAVQEPGSSEAGLSSSNPHAAAPAGPPSDTTIAAAAAAAAAFGGGSSNSTVPGHGSSGTQLTSSEYDDLVADVVSNDSSTQLKLADLEAKLEIISPEDLTVSFPF
jgi:hypothetical protein